LSPGKRDMMKKVRKLIPVSLYDIPGVEQWLEEQAALGLFPESLGSWATFRTGAVPGTRFRLDPFANKAGEGLGPTPEKLELYRRAGWEYAFSIGRAYFLFYTTDPQAPELYTDYESRGLSLDRLVKQLRRYTWSRYILLAVPLLPLLAVLFLPFSRYDVQPDRWARLPLIPLHLCNPVLLLFLAMYLFYLPTDRWEWRTLRNTYRSLKAGLPPPPSPGPSRRILRGNAVSLVLAPILLILLIVTWKTDRSVPLEEFRAPYLSINELETEHMSTYEELFGYDGRSSAEEDQAVRHFSLLAPVWYEVEQQGCSLRPGSQPNAFSPDPQGGRYRYTPSLEMAYLRLAIPAMARPVARAQMDLYRLVDLRWSYEEVDWPGTDLVILATEPEGIWQMAAAAKGSQVVVYRYAGQEDLSDHLDELTSFLTQQ